MSDSLSDIIQPIFDKEDIENFKDKNYKREFLDRLEKETKKNRKSLAIKLNEIIEKKLQAEGIDKKGFVKPRQKKFSSKLNVTNDTNFPDVQDSSQSKTEKDNDDSKNFPKGKNPKLSPVERKELPMGSIAGSVNSFLGAIFEDLEELTDTEKEDIGVCLNMAVGDYLNTHDNARKGFGVVGILGIYGGKIKKARQAKKKRLEKEEKINANSLENLPKLTTEDRQQFDQNSNKFLEQKIVTDT